jgi:hypothetical protein
MRKVLLIGLVLGVVTALAVPAMAVDLTASGWIGMRGYVFKNAANAAPLFVEYVTTPAPAMMPPAWGVRAGMNDQQGAYINSRAQLGFTVRASEDLYGFFNLRMDGRLFGGDRGTGFWAAMGGSQIAVQVQDLYIDFRIPPKLPLWARVGLQPVAIRPWIFMYCDSPGVSLRTMIDPIKLSATAYYVKMADPSTLSAVEGAEFYAIDTKMPLSFGSVNIAPGVFFAYEDIRATALDPLGGFAQDPMWMLTWPEDTTLWWLGVNFDGGVGPVKYQFDFIYNGGEITDWLAPVWDLDVSSWLVSGQVSFVFKKFEVGVAGKYITGEDHSGVPAGTSTTFYLPGERNWTPTGYASEALAVSGDFIVFDNGWFTNGPGWPGMGLIDGPSCYWPGIWNARMFVYYQATDWLRLGAQFGYIGDTVSGFNTVTGYGGDAIGNDADDDDSIGWEFDFGVNLQLYKNLALETGFGYLIAHKALSQAGGYAPEDPWALQSRLMYFF